MPIYEYECPRGHHFTDLQPMPGQPTSTCPICGKRARKIVSVPGAIIFKGGGWAKDGYSKGGKNG